MYPLPSISRWRLAWLRLKARRQPRNLPRTRRKIMRRAAELGMEHAIPPEWQRDGSWRP